MAHQIKLMTDYESWPLWWAGDADPGNIDPNTLPLSAATIARLEAWANAFDATLNRDDPASSDFPSDAAFESFEAEGRALWRQLRDELAPQYQVLYYSTKECRVLADPESS
jgi:hypothetical protein